ncbi:MAG: protein kinase domain-containing protein [Verrucomicrobiales bacterium]
MNSDPDAETIFLQAQQLPPGDREQFLLTACGDRETLRHHLGALLAADAEAGEFLPDSPVSPGREIEPSQESAGAVIGRYKLLQKLGEGGMGTVWMAEQREPMVRRVALKIIKRGMDTQEVVARFEQERQALAMMDHPAIARVLDAGSTESGRPYFVMELVRGVSVTAYCDNKNLGVAERLGIFMQICQAIQHAHQKGVIHRDIKPSNILVTVGDDGEPLPKVIDFGIAKATGAALTDKTLFTQLEQVIGTPAYMSPEQAGLGPLDIDTRSDVYALGVLLYELLTGRPPFDPRDLMKAGLDEMRRVIREEEPVKPSTRISSLTSEELSGTAARRGVAPLKFAAALRGDLDWIVMKAIEKNRNRRYETASGLSSDVQRFLGRQPVTAHPPTAAYLLSRMVRRHKLAFGAGAGVFVSLVLGIGGIVLGLIRAGQSKELAQQRESEAVASAQAERLSGNRVTELLSAAQAERGVRMLQENDPKGLLHLVEARATVDRLPALREARTRLCQGWIDAFSKTGVETLPAIAGARAAAFSPAGDQLAVGGGFKVRIFQLGSPVTFTDIETSAAFGASAPIFTFSSSGKYLVILGRTSQLWKLSADGPPVLDWHWEEPHGLYFSNVGLSQNRRWLAGIFDGVLKIRDLETGEMKAAGAAAADGDSDRCLLPTDDGERLFTATRDTLRMHDLGRPDAAPQIFAPKYHGVTDTDTLHAAPDGSRVILGRNFFLMNVPGAQKETIRNPLFDFDVLGLTPDASFMLCRESERSRRNIRVLLSTSTLQPAPHSFRLAGDVEPDAAAFSEGDSLLALGSRDGVVQVWDWRTGLEIGPSIKAPASAVALALSAERNSLAVVGGDGITRLHPLEARLPFIEPSHQLSDVLLLAAAPDGRVVVASRRTTHLAWFDPTSGQNGPIFSSQEKDGEFIAAATGENGVPLATLRKHWKGEVVLEWWREGKPGPAVTVAAAPESVSETDSTCTPFARWRGEPRMALSRDRQTLVTTDIDKEELVLWDVRTREATARMKPLESERVELRGLRFSPDGRWLAGEYGPMNHLRVWDVPAREPVAWRAGLTLVTISDDWSRAFTSEGIADSSNPRNPVLRHKLEGGESVAFSRDGSRLAILKRDAIINLYDAETGLLAGQMLNTGTKHPLVFSADGALLFGGGSTTGGIGVWDVLTSLPCGLPLKVTGLDFDNLLFTSDGRHIVVADSTLSSWNLPRSQTPLDTLRQAAWGIARARLTPAGTTESLTAEELAAIDAGPH